MTANSWDCCVTSSTNGFRLMNYSPERRTCLKPRRGGDRLGGNGDWAVGDRAVRRRRRVVPCDGPARVALGEFSQIVVCDEAEGELGRECVVVRRLHRNGRQVSRAAAGWHCIRARCRERGRGGRCGRIGLGTAGDGRRCDGMGVRGVIYSAGDWVVSLPRSADPSGNIHRDATTRQTLLIQIRSLIKPCLEANPAPGSARIWHNQRGELLKRCSSSAFSSKKVTACGPWRRASLRASNDGGVGLSRPAAAFPAVPAPDIAPHPRASRHLRSLAGLLFYRAIQCV